MASFVSSILYNSANKIESLSILSNSKSKQNRRKKASKSNEQSDSQQQYKDIGSRLDFYTSTPTLVNGATNNYCYYPQMNYSTESIMSVPPPYEQQQQQQQQVVMMDSSPSPSPSISWTSQMSALAEKIKDDVTNTFKGNSNKQSSLVPNQNNVDRHSISQGMKLVSIAADEYEDGNESIALDIYLTGVDKIIMALPNKTDLSTKITIREKLQEVEERVGILNLVASQKKKEQQHTIINNEENNTKLISSSFIILSRIASTINSVTNKAYQATVSTTANDSKEMSKFSSNNLSTVYMDEREDSMTRFKRFGQYIINVIVTCAILIKQSPLPDLISFIFGYIIQLFLWIDTQYHILEKAQDASIQCIKFGLEADERYHVHEFLTEGFYMLVTAGLKVAIAYKETPRYKDNPTTKYQYTNYQKQTNSTNKVDNSITNMCDLLSNHKNNSQCTKFPITNSTSSTSSTSWAWLSW